MAESNPFLSTHKPSRTTPAVLHPLVLLSISDHITRHTLRGQNGPVCGALLGQQDNTQVTLEETFDFHVGYNGDGVASFDQGWFKDRLEQMRIVHKNPPLDIVGWYTVLSRHGPTPEVVAVHQSIASLCSEAAVLLAFHPEDLDKPSVGGRLPLTIYGTSYEPDGRAGQPRDENAMQEDPEPSSLAAAASPAPATAETGPPLLLKFRTLPYSVETGDAEMISMDFVARGAANASAGGAAASSPSPATTAATEATAAGASASSVSSRAATAAAATDLTKRPKRRLHSVDEDGDSSSHVAAGAKGKEAAVASAASVASAAAPPPTEASRAAAAATTTDGGGVTLSPADEELIASLTTRANAIRMLNGRIQLVAKYLEALSGGGDGGGAPPVRPSLPILRAIQAMVQRLPLVMPPPVGGPFEDEVQRQANDAHLVTTLLDDMMQGIAAVRQTGAKFGALEQARSARLAQTRGGGMGGTAVSGVAGGEYGSADGAGAGGSGLKADSGTRFI